jgi:hypothetical protein
MEGIQHINLKEFISLYSKEKSWINECIIIPGYMPPNPSEDTRSSVVVKMIRKGLGNALFLRHSKGPLQGYFWDMYGSDMHSPELALYALLNSPQPPVCIQCELRIMEGEV